MGHHHDEAEEEQVPFRLQGASGVGRHIVVTAAKRRWLDEHLHRQWRRPPTTTESDRSVEEFVREEVLYREALALGLDRDDLVVRRRLVQKMEILALRDEPTPDESALVAYFHDHQADYLASTTVSLRHVFFSSSLRGAGARQGAMSAIQQLAGPGADTEALGDRPPMPSQVTAWTQTMMAGRFGPDFAAAVFEFVPGGWVGPLRSAFGYHLVLVTSRSPAGVPEFSQVADRVATDLETARRSGALDRIYAQARDAYSVEIQSPYDVDRPAAPGSRSDHDHDHVESERTLA